MRAIIATTFLFFAVWHVLTGSSLLAGGGVLRVLENHAGEVAQHLDQVTSWSTASGKMTRPPSSCERPEKHGTVLLLVGGLSLISAFLLALTALLLRVRAGRALAWITLLIVVLTELLLLWALGGQLAVVVAGLFRLSALAACALLLFHQGTRYREQRAAH